MAQFNARPSLALFANDHRTSLALSSQVTIVGAIHFDGPIHLDGVVQGEVRCQALTVSERGAVDGLIVADSVTVTGDVNGSIYANKLVLKSPCKVEGEIYHRELDMQDGCYFEGKSRRYASPLGLAPVEE